MRLLSSPVFIPFVPEMTGRRLGPGSSTSPHGFRVAILYYLLRNELQCGNEQYGDNNEVIHLTQEREKIGNQVHGRKCMGQGKPE